MFRPPFVETKSGFALPRSLRAELFTIQMKWVLDRNLLVLGVSFRPDGDRPRCRRRAISGPG